MKYIYILLLFFISLSCSSQGRVNRLNSLSFGKSKLSLDTIIKYSKDTNAMKRLTGQLVAVERVGDWSEETMVSYENKSFIVLLRSPVIDYEVSTVPNKYWIQKNAKGEESTLNKIEVAYDMKGVVYVNGIELRLGDPLSKVSATLNEYSAIFLDDRGGGISIVANDATKIQSIRYWADIYDNFEPSSTELEYIKLSASSILPEGSYKQKVLEKLNKNIQTEKANEERMKLNNNH